MPKAAKAHWLPPKPTPKRLNLYKQQAAILAEIAKGNEKRMGELLKSVEFLILTYARKFGRYYGCSTPVEDLESEGRIGAMTAARRFDPSFNVKFSTYAMHYITQSMRRYVENNGSTVRTPVFVLQNKEELQKKYNPSSYKAMLLATIGSHNKVMSLDSPIGDGDRTHGDMLPCESSPDTDISIAKRNRELKQALVCLSESEMRVVKAYFFDNDDATLASVGVDFKLSRERIRQIRDKALIKIKKYLKKKGYDENNPL